MGRMTEGLCPHFVSSLESWDALIDGQGPFARKGARNAWLGSAYPRKIELEVG
jgi:hypothetical protein